MLFIRRGTHSSAVIRRYYCSTSSINGSLDTRPNILQSSLKHVAKYGWTVEALAQGAKDNNLPPTAHGMFPNGGYDLVHYFVDQSNKNLAKQLSERRDQLVSMRLRDRVAEGVKLRLSMIGPYISRWPQAVSLLAHPANATSSLKLLALLADEIWHHAGDTSTDFSWYSKRAMLAGVYTSSELHMMSDTSEGFKDTMAFVDRRMDDIIQFSRFKRDAGMAVDTVVDMAARALPSHGSMSSVLRSAALYPFTPGFSRPEPPKN
eukprot:TRINITY_DN15569_c1_g2_i2.p1 TRINITY_DN15569_c1_g2~~TRINITY_DN15569_c1_g2_i2.p1  ORF type:complete len:262 (-),score=33.75 TRINITY_DN15569_c1_g2_i2:32-817(-)